MSGRELPYIQQAFDANWIAPVGPDINAFEQAMADYVQSPHAVALSSGSAALHLALRLCGVGPGDEVVCSTFTFAGSAFPITYCGAQPLFVDSEEQSWNMDPGLLEQLLIERHAAGKLPKAVIVVHLYGIPAQLDALVDICERFGVELIEDAAESLGATFSGRQSGTFGRLGVFSFNGNKIITTSGGGMLMCRDEADAQRARFWATQARDDAPHYQHSQIGYNYRMSNIVACIGRGQLEVLTQRIERKREIFEWYRSIFSSIPGVSMMPEPPGAQCNYWLSCVVIDEKQAGFSAEQLRLAFEADTIESRPLWKPMHLQPVFAQCKAMLNGIAQHLFEQGLCLPSGTAMAQPQLQRIQRVIQQVAAGSR
jgi:pyridoxal phosphate-dependent aminotransferase EpsN